MKQILEQLDETIDHIARLEDQLKAVYLTNEQLNNIDDQLREAHRKMDTHQAELEEARGGSLSSSDSGGKTAQNSDTPSSVDPDDVKDVGNEQRG